ncbi:hypothetical protein ABZX65_14475 [Streptomyces sp. NPDC003300]|uniref:hypothetical protein n=1 Tax=unclassified Streptomyces TaxID=2593676 RepID=UPI0033AA3C27
MQGWKKTAVIMCTVVCAVAAVGLTVLAVAVDTATANQVGSLIGAVVSLAGFTVSVWALLHSPVTAVEASDGGVAAGGSIGRVVRGNNNSLTSSPTAQPPPASHTPSIGSVRADGSGSAAAAGNVGDVITGDGNTT